MDESEGSGRPAGQVSADCTDWEMERGVLKSWETAAVSLQDCSHSQRLRQCGRKKQARKSLSSQMQARVLTLGCPSVSLSMVALGLQIQIQEWPLWSSLKPAAVYLFLCLLEMPLKTR